MPTSLQILVTVNDINDNIPQLVFSSFSTEYIIPENITRLTTITTIEATDSDLSPLIEFEIVEDTSKIIYQNLSTFYYNCIYLSLYYT